MIHVKKNIRDSFQFVLFFFGGGGVGRAKLQMSFKKIKTAVWIQPRPQGFSLKKWVGREKALASAGHVSPRTP